MKNLLKDAARWALRSSETRIDTPMSRIGFEVRRSTLIPMNDSKVRRLLYFGRMFDHIRNVAGDVVECGVRYGESFLLLSFLARDEAKQRKIWGFDSFEPSPRQTAKDKVDTARKGQPSEVTGIGVSTTSVEKLLLDAGIGQDFVSSQVTLVRGHFDNTLDKFTGKAIALLHVDVDHDSYPRVLEELYPRVAIGGVIMFNEYMGTNEPAYLPEAQRAIDEFFGERRPEIRQDTIAGQYYLIKDAN
jgi:Macrocin-O-methyltransferase (TylF)